MAQVGYGPLERIDGPLPIPPPYGLLQAMSAPATGVRMVVDTGDGDVVGVDISSTGQTIEEAIAELKANGSLPAAAGDLRWLNGVEVYPYPPGQADAYNACGANSATDTTKSFGDELQHPQFSAITLYVAESCKSYKVWNQAEFRARATTALTAVQGSALARQLLTGEADPMSPYLADGNCVLPTASVATSAINALAILEEYIGLSGQLGLIHCSPGYATTLLGRGFAVDDKTGVIRTINGNILIPDSGYARAASEPAYGSPQKGTASSGSQEWIYATGPIDVRLSEIFMIPEQVSQALDRGTSAGATTGRPNTFTYRAERYALATWDTELHVGVLADRCATGC
jgi:hypothetical protein